MIYRWKHPSWQSHMWGIVQGFAEIADGLVILCTLGFFASGFEMKVASQRAKKYFQKAMADKAKLKERSHE